MGRFETWDIGIQWCAEPGGDMDAEGEAAPASAMRRPARRPDAAAGQPGADPLGDAFRAELAYWRKERGLSKKQLAIAMGFDPSYVSHIESGRHRPTEDFSRRAESVLGSGTALWRRWQAYENGRRREAGGRAHPGPAGPGAVPPVLIEHEDARLAYTGGVYEVAVRRDLRNVGTDPISRFLVRMSVDRYPHDPQRSARLYRTAPLTWSELQLTADCHGEPMAWQPKTDRDSCKEAWLLFENKMSRFPLYPGEAASIHYTYRVSDRKWGPFFQRAIRLPTARLSIQVTLPSDLYPAITATETSMTSACTSIEDIGERSDSGSTVFEWSGDHPAVEARFRFEWTFGVRPGEPF
jgi:transcriptional regulator with XRE-family HTH domain